MKRLGEVLAWVDQAAGKIPDEYIIRPCQWFLYFCAGLLFCTFMCLIYAVSNALYVMGAWPTIGWFLLYVTVGVLGLCLAVALLIALIAGAAWVALTVSNFYLDWKERRESSKL